MRCVQPMLNRVRPTIRVYHCDARRKSDEQQGSTLKQYVSAVEGGLGVVLFGCEQCAVLSGQCQWAGWMEVAW